MKCVTASLCVLFLLMSCGRARDAGDDSAAQQPSAASGAAPSDVQAPPALPPALPHYGIEIIDAHVHIVPNMVALAQALDVFEKSGISRFVAFSGGEWGSIRFASTVGMARVLGDRFRFLCNIDWEGFDEPGWMERTLQGLEHARASGAVGVKVFKALGLKVRDRNGELVPVDDARLDPLFDKAGKLGLTFAIHVADPVAFFQPVTPQNERYDELTLATGWSFHGEDYPTHAELMRQQEARVSRHPNTTFMLVHMGNNGEDLDYVDRLLTKYSNVHVNISARVPEFGRKPAGMVRAFFVKHQDRIQFGSDFVSSSYGMQLGSVSKKEPDINDAVEFFGRHWRYFETSNRQIDHPTPIQGNWKVDAIDLPETVLKKLYHDNAWNMWFARFPISDFRLSISPVTR